MWDVRLKQLLEFRAAHGHLDVPRGWRENPALAHWVVNQRRDLRQGRMMPERVRRIEEAGIHWSGAEDRRKRADREWDRMFQALAAYRGEHGHGNVPSGWPTPPKLGLWVARQRHQYRRGSLREDRRRRVEELAVGWPEEPGRSRSRDLVWDRMLAALVAFRETHSHGNVPKGWPENPTLARWVARQRRLHRSGGLRSDRRLRLEDLGVLGPAGPRRSASAPPTVGVREQAWTRMLETLATFKFEQGHCSVPRRWALNPALARWVSEQRRLRGKGRLTPDRVRLLEALGFEWAGARSLKAARSSTWAGLCRRLHDYKKRRGTSDVPARFPEDPALGRWVAAQRTLRRSGGLSRDRVRRLNALGFSWSLRRTRRVH